MYNRFSDGFLNNQRAREERRSEVRAAMSEKRSFVGRAIIGVPATFGGGLALTKGFTRPREGGLRMAKEKPGLLGSTTALIAAIAGLVGGVAALFAAFQPDHKTKPSSTTQTQTNSPGSYMSGGDLNVNTDKH
jgi:hypothetical protein